MPQIDQIATIYASQLVWLLIVFAVIYVVIGKGMLPKIEGTIHARNDKIAGDLAAAERARDEGTAVETAYHAEMDAAHQGASSAVQAAKDAAVRDAEVKLKAAQDDMARKVHHAELALAEARARALTDIENVAADAVRDIVQRLSGISVTEGDALSAVRVSLNAA
jgi:F-type H+-transporting ATPase subunit b